MNYLLDTETISVFFSNDNNAPEHCVELDKDTYKKFYLDAPPEGKCRGIIGGKLTWVDKTPVLVEDMFLYHMEVLKANFEAKNAQLMRWYPDSERSTWSTQREQLSAYRKDTDASVPLLSQLAALRGVSLDDFCTALEARIEDHDTKLAPVLAAFQLKRDELFNIFNNAQLLDDEKRQLITDMDLSLEG
ncbi:hypothetical protein [Endozoicomonas sp. ONNA1]|uniref:hypothetical protein n=1 Tax=Endozoicomonas sp. ONNA1 TaxID=2828740 RepID=UPI002149268A|nr:hypothetical protein [Endozoicomonas sp. ONNA1]